MGGAASGSGGTGFEIAKDGMSGLVVGLDGSDPSRDALAFASGVARREDAWIVAVFVSPVTDAADLTAAGAADARDAADVVAAELAEVVLGVVESGLRCEFVRRMGDVAAELEAAAAEHGADCIVVGRSHSRAHRLAGSVPVRLVRTARRPILVVP